MANLGAEVSRIFSAKEAIDEKRVKESFERAQKIIEELMTIPDMKTRKVEVDLLREAILSATKLDNNSDSSKKNLMTYFTPFALRLMNTN